MSGHSHGAHLAAAAGVSSQPLANPLAARHGTLEGHVLPGVLFLVWGSWWSLALLARLAREPGEGSSRPRRLSTPWHLAPTALPAALALVEPLCKAVLPLLGVWDELVPWQPLFDGVRINHEPIHGLQHVVMYVSVLLSGLTDLALLREPRLPRGLDGAALVAAFCSQAFVLLFHLGGAPLDIRLHLLLVITTFVSAAATAAALLRPASLLAAFVRCLALLTLGSFWIEAGDVMYRRPAMDSNEGVALAPVMLLLHVACWFLALLSACLLALHAAPREEAADPEAAKAHD